MNIDNIKKSFEDAGLVLQFAKEPFARGANAVDIFGLDIRRKFGNNARSEYFLMWPGHEDNVVHIAAIDKKINQLVLTIKEPEREFEEEVLPIRYRPQVKLYGNDWLNKWIEETKPTVPRKGRPGTRLATRADFNWADGKLWVKLLTPGNVRHFLMGRDERQLFMCQLSKAATSVQAAHDSLKAPTVVLAEGKQLGRTYRQGEWFFLNLTKEEEEEVAAYLKKSTKIVQKKANIGEFAGRTGGKPHVVDELITLKARPLEHGWPIRQRDEVFVRGAVRHPDHETLKIGSWRKVILNNEAGRTADIGTFVRLGGTWID